MIRLVTNRKKRFPEVNKNTNGLVKFRLKLTVLSSGNKIGLKLKNRGPQGFAIYTDYCYLYHIGEKSKN